ncbi:hypothetical protein HN766_21405, partial [Candidatus Poribacteria bacterium]|nr:hypothetical protein [Candidatus Poribacteria bacterium]
MEREDSLDNTGHTPCEARGGSTVGAALYDQICDPKLLQRALDRVARNNGGPGVDGVTVEQFLKEAEWKLEEIRRDLDLACYAPDRLLHMTVPKPDGRARELAIPTVRDRVTLTAIAWTLDTILDPEFSPSSFAYRTGRSIRDAIDMICVYRDAGCRWATHVDIETFFDDIDRELLLTLLLRRVDDNEILSLVEAFLEAPALCNGEPDYPERGISQGSPLSPLLSNLYLHELDVALEQDGGPFVRYADNILALSETEAAARAVLQRIVLDLHALGLSPGEENTYLTSFERGFRFLGAHFLGNSVRMPGREGRIRISGGAIGRGPT